MTARNVAGANALDAWRQGVQAVLAEREAFNLLRPSSNQQLSTLRGFRHIRHDEGDWAAMTSEKSSRPSFHTTLRSV